MDDRTRGTLGFSSAMAIAGTIGWFVVTLGLPPAVVVFWRCFFAGCVLLAVCARTGLLRGRLTPRAAAMSALTGLAMALNWLLLFDAFAMASISVATAVYNIQPFILLAFGALFLGEHITVAKLAWLTVAFTGLLMILAGAPEAAAVGRPALAGAVMAFGAAVFWAIAALVGKRLSGTPPQLIALIQACVGALVFAPFAHLAHPPASPKAWAILVTLGVVHTGLVYVLMYDSIHRLPTHLQGALSFLYPVVAILVDVLAFGRRFTATEGAGVAAILLAAMAMNIQRVTAPLSKARQAAAGDA